MAEHQTDRSSAELAGGTVDAAEIARFSAMADAWWDPTGKFKPLHVFNPVRIQFIRDTILKHLARQGGGLRPLEGVRLLDIGCGGGLLCEPLTRLGAQVVGIDASNRNIEVARLHAAQAGLEIDYRCTTAEALVAAGESFDVVLSMEVVEHVADPDLFLKSIGQLAKPGGLVIAATLNRTAKSFALAIVGAEYVLRWLPRGTHQWDKFVTPDELEIAMERAGLRTTDERGVIYNLLADRWELSRDMDVNYMVKAERAA
jgi:2-polyprenyl-6-hydroxyphenyl methylase/3-demethylubiquinone-9 3-methyltransferase